MQSQKSNILSLLHRILLSHTLLSQGLSNSATAYVTRLLRRILSALGSESRAGSPPTMVQATETIPGEGEGQYDVFAELGLVSLHFSSLSTGKSRAFLVEYVPS